MHLSRHGSRIQRNRTHHTGFARGTILLLLVGFMAIGTLTACSTLGGGESGQDQEATQRRILDRLQRKTWTDLSKVEKQAPAEVEAERERERVTTDPFASPTDDPVGDEETTIESTAFADVDTDLQEQPRGWKPFGANETVAAGDTIEDQDLVDNAELTTVETLDVEDVDPFASLPADDASTQNAVAESLAETDTKAAIEPTAAAADTVATAAGNQHAADNHHAADNQHEAETGTATAAGDAAESETAGTGDEIAVAVGVDAEVVDVDTGAQQVDNSDGELDFTSSDLTYTSTDVFATDPAVESLEDSLDMDEAEVAANPDSSSRSNGAWATHTARATEDPVEEPSSTVVEPVSPTTQTPVDPAARTTVADAAPEQADVAPFAKLLGGVVAEVAKSLSESSGAEQPAASSNGAQPDTRVSARPVFDEQPAVARSTPARTVSQPDAGSTAPDANAGTGLQETLAMATPREEPDAEPEELELTSSMPGGMTMEMRDVPLKDLIRAIAQQSQMNVIVPETLTERVSISLEGVDPRDALESILKSHGYGLIKDGALHRIETISEAEKRMISKTFTLTSIPIDTIQDSLETILSENGKLIMNDDSPSFVMIDFPENIDAMSEYLGLIDRREKQVLIEVQILEVILSNNEAIGTVLEALDISIDDVTGAYVHNLAPDDALAAIGFAHNKSPINLIIEALSINRRLNILSTPKLITLNGREAKIEVLSSIPYIDSTATTSTSTEGGGAVVIEQVEFKESGITVKVTPIIGNDGYVKMAIEPQVKELVDFFNGIPVIDTRKIETNVIVKDGNTVILGGLLREEEMKETQKVPLLGDIPLIGSIFRRRETTQRKSELLVFITPYIISSDNEAKLNSEADERLERAKGVLGRE